MSTFTLTPQIGFLAQCNLPGLAVLSKVVLGQRDPAPFQRSAIIRSWWWSEPTWSFRLTTLETQRQVKPQVKCWG